MKDKPQYENASIESAWEMMSFISAELRETWITVGMVLKSNFGDLGFSSFDRWSDTAPNYDSRAVVSAWKSFKGGARGMGSLVYLASQNGWRHGAEVSNRPAPKPSTAPKQSRSTTAYAKQLFLDCNRNDQYVADHAYAKNKGLVQAFGAGRGKASGKLIGKNADCIIVPIRNIETGLVWGVQCINSAGTKQTFGEVSGGALILGNTLNLESPWYIVEGWASAASTVYHHHKEVCVCSFGKSNQDAAAKALDKTYKPNQLVILVEVDE